MAGLIDDYGMALQRRLNFDYRLARRAREEVEAHLHDSLDGCDEREAISRFGSLEQIAAGYAAATLARSRRVALDLACALAVTTFIGMRLRSIWLFDDAVAMPVSSLATAIDRTGLFAGIILCVVGWYWSRARDHHRVTGLLAGILVALSMSMLASLYRASSVLIAQGSMGLLHKVIATGAIEMALLAFLAFRLHLLNRQNCAAAGG